MYKLCFFVPASHLEATKAALFEAGAGRFGNYQRCCWQVEGQGQFEPLPGSRPHLGRPGEVAVVREYRVEMVCADDAIGPAIAALRAVHPYETPAYDAWRLADL